MGARHIHRTLFGLIPILLLAWGCSEEPSLEDPELPAVQYESLRYPEATSEARP